MGKEIASGVLGLLLGLVVVFLIVGAGWLDNRNEEIRQSAMQSAIEEATIEHLEKEHSIQKIVTKEN